MCVVSFVGGHFEDKWKPLKPYTTFTTSNFISEVTKEEFEALKKEVLEMKELLRKAKIYDEVNNEPNCELESKMEFLRGVAKLVGIDLDDVLKNKDLTQVKSGTNEKH